MQQIEKHELKEFPCTLSLQSQAAIRTMKWHVIKIGKQYVFSPTKAIMRKAVYAPDDLKRKIDPRASVFGSIKEMDFYIRGIIRDWYFWRTWELYEPYEDLLQELKTKISADHG
ncbi:MAG: hypothetical protein IJ766_05035 [Clostridia bacterium]|nr:hypothetical protein [Clostridia bacterium]